MVSAFHCIFIFRILDGFGIFFAFELAAPKGVGIVHRDIKPPSESEKPILVYTESASCLSTSFAMPRPDNFLWGGPGNKTLKLCDYGLDLVSRAVPCCEGKL